jgi:hypothetical protein
MFTDGLVASRGGTHIERTLRLSIQMRIGAVHTKRNRGLTPARRWMRPIIREWAGRMC